jgi:2-polyprenyl-3-methyl-5-hydroxy-6-metoxy-1,4-benzoquinol methylase
MLRNDIVERGQRGYTPALTTRADEALLDYISDMRNQLMHSPHRRVEQQSAEALKHHGLTENLWPGKVDEMRTAMAEVPEVATWLRVKRSLQEAYWQTIMDSYSQRQDDFLHMLEVSDSEGPGSVSWDPDFKYPEYATVDIHIQPGGYVTDPLCGLHYDYGTKVFFGGVNDSDALYAKMASKTAMPQDGKVERIMDIGCAIGQFACAMKARFPDAEVWGTDIGAPMVRYAHHRAAKQGLDIHFAQMASEDLNFPDNHFDLVTAHLLFHELPVPVIKQTLAEAARVLRPGGTFVLWNFPSEAAGDGRFAGFIRYMDAADNGEPYSCEFVSCNVESLFPEAGLTLRYTDLDDIARHGRVGDKPA